jgi:hypothetical protein
LRAFTLKFEVETVVLSANSKGDVVLETKGGKSAFGTLGSDLTFTFGETVLAMAADGSVETKNATVAADGAVTLRLFSIDRDGALRAPNGQLFMGARYEGPLEARRAASFLATMERIMELQERAQVCLQALHQNKAP